METTEDLTIHMVLFYSPCVQTCCTICGILSPTAAILLGDRDECECKECLRILTLQREVSNPNKRRIRS